MAKFTKCTIKHLQNSLFIHSSKEWIWFKSDKYSKHLSFLVAFLLQHFLSDNFKLFSFVNHVFIDKLNQICVFLFNNVSIQYTGLETLSCIWYGYFVWSNGVLIPMEYLLEQTEPDSWRPVFVFLRSNVFTRAYHFWHSKIICIWCTKLNAKLKTIDTSSRAVYLKLDLYVPFEITPL